MPRDSAGLFPGTMLMHKFMVALDQRVFSELERVATDRNITIQELLRAIVVPEWFRTDQRADLTPK